MIKKLSALIILLVGVFLAVAPGAKAAILENAYLSINNPRSEQTGVTHDFFFYHSSTTIGSIQLRYCVEPSGGCTDSGTSDNLGAGALDYVEADGAVDDTANWTASWNDGSYWWRAYRDTADSDADGSWEFRFTNMKNPARTTCNEDGGSSTGTCYVRINTYSGTQYTGTADNGTVSITITQEVTVSARVDPTFTLTIAGVTGAGQTLNSTVITALTTTVTTIPFGNLTADTAKFLAHTLTVTANNSGGYTITADMDANLTGTAYGDDIDGYIGNSATNTASKSWTSPTGSTSGTHTGWLGVGTDDTGVTGRGNNQFFTLGTSGTIVAQSDGPSSSRASNVVYAIQVNAFQQADNYTGAMTYVALPTY